MNRLPGGVVPSDRIADLLLDRKLGSRTLVRCPRFLSLQIGQLGLLATVLESAGALTIRNLRVHAGMDAEVRIGQHSHHLRRMEAAQLARTLRYEARPEF